VGLIFYAETKIPARSQPYGSRIQVQVTLCRYEVNRAASYLYPTWEFWWTQSQWGGVFANSST